eukprot:5085411-Pyramimonas_sp.AAC.1
MSNAFASCSHQELDATVDMRVANELGVPLAQQRYHEPRICLPTSEGPPCGSNLVREAPWGTPSWSRCSGARLAGRFSPGSIERPT